MAKKSNLPPDALEAKVTIVNREWRAVYLKDGKVCLVKITKTDAWNFDIEKGLTIFIRVEGDTCKILRKRGNKKYVTVDNVPEP